jgi:hypothetical protein
MEVSKYLLHQNQRNPLLKKIIKNQEQEGSSNLVLEAREKRVTCNHHDDAEVIDLNVHPKNCRDWIANLSVS